MFTPPRDDFAGIPLPGQVNSPREVSRTADQSTLQAAALLCRVVCFSLIVACVIAVSYSILSLVIREPITLHCKEQPIQNGKLMPGVAGSTAIVMCNDGFEKGPTVKVKCLMVAEKCVITKKATVLKEEVKKCWRRYAYVSPKFAEKALLNGTTTFGQLDDEEEHAIPGACVSARSKGNAQEASKLFQQRESPTVLRSHWQPLCMPSSAAIVLVTLAVLLLAGLAKTIAHESALRPPGGYAFVQGEADDELPEGQE